jgi:hypothetical protein
MSETQKLVIQLVEAARAVPGARTERGITSLITTHETGLWTNVSNGGAQRASKQTHPQE